MKITVLISVFLNAHMAIGGIILLINANYVILLVLNVMVLEN